MNLFEFAETYPNAAGFKREGTSQAAAQSIDASTLRGQVLALLHPALQVTADEAADLMGLSVLSVRPRFSELRALGKVVDSGERRPNNSGRSAVVWRLA